MSYNHQKIEKYWQNYWEKEKLFEVKEDPKKKAEKKYLLDMFPYPSAQGLHVGHPESYTATDIMARYFKMRGYAVLQPMGFDAFGLPAENYAIKTGCHPKKSTVENIKRIRRQIKSLGLAYDWSREVNTTDPDYYHWTQWIFLQLFKNDLAYEAIVPINWCPSCKTGLANEEVIEGKCERCGTLTEKKDMRQWMLRITAYADRLLKDIDDVDWEERIKDMQKNWIGRSEGAEIHFVIKDTEEKINVFTTRPDTLYGVTYAVLAPENEIVGKIFDKITNQEEVKKYVVGAGQKSELERTSLVKEKTGVLLEGIKVLHPLTGEELSVWVADYVLGYYATGAVMAVPAHDERDFAFAKKYNLPVKVVIVPSEDRSWISEKVVLPEKFFAAAYTGPGFLVNSQKFSGLPSEEVKEKIVDWLVGKKLAKRQANYHMRDWVFSRQRYWGEPIPIIKCPKCGNVPLEEKDLPLKLPCVKNYKPTGTGESPLADIKKWVNVKCPKCGGPAKRETNTMPQWAGSSWYWLRYVDPHNKKSLADYKKLERWLPVDLYVGGAEHAVLHLLYARFWNKFLCDIGAVPRVRLPNGKLSDEPFYKLRNQGMILGEDGEKMSKSRGNVINPDEIIKEYGADTLRIYEMFMGPLESVKPWSAKSIVGVRRFLDRVWRLDEQLKMQNAKCEIIPISSRILDKVGTIQNSKLEKIVYQTIKKVTEDIEAMKFNTAIAALMIFLNEIRGEAPETGEINCPIKLVKPQWEQFLKLLCPFAPHLAEELWREIGHKKSIFTETWPVWEARFMQEDEVELIVQINGKLRDRLRVAAGIGEAEAKQLVLQSEKIQKWLEGKKVKQVIFVRGKLINIVI
ncbi:MAG: leucine--tRNA ligase [bacterium]|nr:leucine--tRNA ligase [bacterium]